MYKHYLRLDHENYIVKSFSDAFEQPLNTDILLRESESRQFYTDEQGFNPDLSNYKYENGKIVYKEKPFVPQPIVKTPEQKSIEELQIAVASMIGV